VGRKSITRSRSVWLAAVVSQVPKAGPYGTCNISRGCPFDRDEWRESAILPGMTRPPERKLLDCLAGYDPHISGLTLALREVVLEEAPEAIESIVKGYATAIGFSFTGKPMKDGFCHVVAYGARVNLGFNRGALLPDPNHVLKGTGKMIRHVTIESMEDLERPWLRRYLRTAIEMVGGPGKVVAQRTAREKTAKRAESPVSEARPGKRGSSTLSPPAPATGSNRS